MNRDNLIGSIILEGATTAEDTVIIDGTRSKRVIAESTLQDTDVENRNHRVYAKADLEPEIYGERIQELIAAKQMRGEMGHPLADSIVRQQTIDPKLVCVEYMKIWMEGNLVKCHYKGTNNDYGQMIDEDLREGCKPAFSLRALGAIENVNGRAYVRGIRVITYDYVIYPSHRIAYTTRLVTENALSCDIDPTSVNESMVITDPNNDTGRIINLTGSDAQEILNRLQRESASVSSILETFEGLSDHVCVVGDKLKLSTRFGETMYLDMDHHIDNLIMNYAWGSYK